MNKTIPIIIVEFNTAIRTIKYIKEFIEKVKVEENISFIIVDNGVNSNNYAELINSIKLHFNINDEKCEYVVELGRRQKNNNISIPNNYLYVTSSNKIESPNGHVLFEKAQKTLYYRNVKTNKTYSKDVANLEFIKYFGRIYNLTSLYKEIYKDENIFNINNPTSTFM